MKAEPKPRGRPRKVTLAEPAEVQYYEPAPPTADQLHAYVIPLLQAYAAHLQMSKQSQKRQQYRELFQSVYGP